MLAATTLAAQAPPGWKVRADDPKADMTKLAFDRDEAGLPRHHRAGGDLLESGEHGERATSRSIRRSSSSARAAATPRRTALLLGGKDLETAADYVYFMLRNDGKYLVKHRAGNGDTHLITDWTQHPAVVMHQRRRGDTVKNAISVAATSDSVRFSVNGKHVASYPRSHMNADGIVGLRVNHGLNLHISKLVVSK